eukprot:m.13237 g.13237  ORF g.13237 m.13237 type:complete len:162 (-) comp6148_c0_seq1:37-522(-)
MEWTVEGHTVLILHGAVNGAELLPLITSGTFPAACVRDTMILDPFQLLVAVQRAVFANKIGAMKTKSLNSEILYALSPSKSIRDSLVTFGVGATDTSAYAVLVDPIPETKAAVAAHVREHTSSRVPVDEAALQKVYKITAPQLQSGTLLDLIVSSIATKGL